MKSYIGIVHKDKGSDYGVSFPDFPGCITAGKTPEEAYSMAVEALPFHIEGMQEDGEAIPEPSSMAKLMKEPACKGSIMTFMVAVRLPGKARRVNIVMDEELLSTIDSVSKNRSAFLAEAARQKLKEYASFS